MNFLLALIFLASSAASAIGSANEYGCEFLLRSTPIPQTIQPAYVIEMESAGEIINPEKNIPFIDTGFYVFLITKKGEILLANKYNTQSFLQTGKGLATHKSLLKMYAERTMASAHEEIVGSGEFQVVAGVVIDISNRSGNFRGDPVRHQSVIEFLTERGLRLDSDLSVRTIDPLRVEDRGHTPADREFNEFHLVTMAEVQRSADGRKLRAFYDELLWLLKETFPELSPRAAVAKMGKFCIAGWRKNHSGEPMSFLFPLSAAFERDGMDFGIAGSLRVAREALSHDPHRADPYSISAGIHSVILGAGEFLSPELRKKWMDLALGFK